MSLTQLVGLIEPVGATMRGLPCAARCVVYEYIVLAPTSLPMWSTVLMPSSSTLSTLLGAAAGLIFIVYDSVTSRCATLSVEPSPAKGSSTPWTPTTPIDAGARGDDAADTAAADDDDDEPPYLDSRCSTSIASSPTTSSRASTSARASSPEMDERKDDMKVNVDECGSWYLEKGQRKNGQKEIVKK